MNHCGGVIYDSRSPLGSVFKKHQLVDKTDEHGGVSRLSPPALLHTRGKAVQEVTHVFAVNSFVLGTLKSLALFRVALYHLCLHVLKHLFGYKSRRTLITLHMRKDRVFADVGIGSAVGITKNKHHPVRFGLGRGRLVSRLGGSRGFHFGSGLRHGRLGEWERVRDGGGVTRIQEDWGTQEAENDLGYLRSPE